MTNAEMHTNTRVVEIVWRVSDDFEDLLENENVGWNVETFFCLFLFVEMRI